MNRLLWGHDFGRCFCGSNWIFWCLDVGWCWVFVVFFWITCCCNVGVTVGWSCVSFFSGLGGWFHFNFEAKIAWDMYIYIYLHMLLYSCLLYDNFSVVWTPSSLYSMCMQNFHLLILCCGDHPWGMQKTPQWRKEYPRSKSGGFGCYNCFHRFVVADSCFSNGEFFQQSSGCKIPLESLAIFGVHNFFGGANISNIQHNQQFVLLPRRGGECFFSAG